MSEHHLVYVHGICQHSRGYSDAWFASMRPFVPSLAPGDLSSGPGDLSKNRHEVLWSDLVNEPADEEAFAAATSSAEISSIGAFKEERRLLVAELEQRRQAVLNEIEATAAASGGDFGAMQDGGFSIPGISCVDDFMTYLMNEDVREQVIGRCLSVLRPLLDADKRVEVIAHSWGTVVVYESLRRLDQASIGVVRNFFTVGSALAINFVNSRLLPEASDRRRPALVDRWVNLDAFGDFVGGSLVADGFEIEPEDDHTGLAAVGCGFIPTPSCAHSSYFISENEVVNQGIFGACVETP